MRYGCREPQAEPPSAAGEASLSDVAHRVIALAAWHGRLRRLGLLRSFGYETRGFDSAEAFLAWEGSGGCDCVITDIHMPGSTNGIEVARQAAAGLARHVDLGAVERDFFAGNLDGAAGAARPLARRVPRISTNSRTSDPASRSPRAIRTSPFSSSI